MLPSLTCVLWAGLQRSKVLCEWEAFWGAESWVLFTGPLLCRALFTLSQDWERLKGFWPTCLWRVLNRGKWHHCQSLTFINHNALKTTPGGLWNLKHVRGKSVLEKVRESTLCDCSSSSKKPMLIPGHTFLLSPCIMYFSSMLSILLPVHRSASLMFFWTTILCPRCLQLEVEKGGWNWKIHIYCTWCI